MNYRNKIKASRFDFQKNNIFQISNIFEKKGTDNYRFRKIVSDQH